MKKLILLIFSLIITSYQCVAFDFDAHKWTDFEGTLGKSSIQLSLYRFDNGQLKGNYCYKKYESKIQLTGQISGDRIVVTELLNGRVNGRFEGKVFTDSHDRFEGTWTDSSGTKSIEFKLTLQAIGGSDYEHRYTDFYGSDKDVEKFMKKMKSAILKGDKAWVASHTRYPVKPILYMGTEMTIKNKAELIELFDQIFHQEFKDKLKTLCVCNLFSNYTGIMLGNGQIWIHNKRNSTKDKFDFEIISINN